MVEREVLDFEIVFYERLLKDKPDFVEVLVALGDAYTRKGLYEKGLEVDKRLSVMRPNDAYVQYNLACSLSLLSELDEAIAALKKAISLGYCDFAYMEKDPDLDNVKRDSRYQKLFGSRRE